jgi:8-oxo-dGTP pyrophosphatase MutT (NUDIX family)
MQREEERSAGAIIYYENGDRRLYLLLHYPAGHWDFPKGNIEKGESPLDTAKREVYEETGLEDIYFVPGFEKRIEYFYRREGTLIHKEVIYYLAKSKSKEVKISYEHKGFKWLGYREALKRATYRNSKEVLKAAEDYLSRQGSGINRYIH